MRSPAHLAEADRRLCLLTGRIAAMTSTAAAAEWDAGEYVVERDAALKALASLPERDIEVLTLVTWHALDPHEAATVLGYSPPCVRHRAAPRQTPAPRGRATHGPRPGTRAARLRPLPPRGHLSSGGAGMNDDDLMKLMNALNSPHVDQLADKGTSGTAIVTWPRDGHGPGAPVGR